MSTVYRVVVKGGGKNLYYIKEDDDTYCVYHHIVNVVWDDENLIGEDDSLEDAVERIKDHSGERIDEIEEM